MGQRVNFNKKSNNSKTKKVLWIVGAVLIVIILGLLIKKYLEIYKVDTNADNTVALHYDTGSYNSLAELLYAYDTELLRIDESTNVHKIYVSFSKNLYSLEESNQKHFEAIIKVVADYKGYIDFELIDTARDIEIKVTCQDDTIIQIVINGDENYFLNNDSKINQSKDKAEITNFTIQSKELQAFIDNNWIDSNVTIGTRESRCNEYDIYFDEGIKYKKVSGEVFNLIFTEKYEGQVAGGLNVTATPDEVKNALGNPTFSEYNNIYGYVSEENYLFFDFLNDEISIYPVKEITEADEKELEELINEMNKSEDLKTFASDLMDLWIDYDEYNYNENLLDLRYTLKGFSLEFSMTNLGDDGIFIYQNYSGNINITNLENVYMADKNSVFEAEKARANGDALSRIEQGQDIEYQYEIYGVDFAIRFKGNLNDSEVGYKGPYFLSRDKSYPDSELDRTLVISSFKWYDDYRVMYSINDDGIYMYDCRNRENVLVKDKLEGVITITEVTENTIVYNEDFVININVQ